jgi:ABC-type branched-subunit amino acid transport system substrate-binding protein
MLNAIEALRKSGQPLTGAELQRQLKATNLRGITGVIQFDQHNDLLQADYQRLTYDSKGQKVPVQ